MNKYKFDRKLTIIVTAALMLDWVPGYFGLDPHFYSGTKLIALPLIIFDIIAVNPNAYLRLRYGLLFLLTMIIGTSAGVLFGNVPFQRLWELLPVPLILLFYLKPRTHQEVISILRLCFYLSLPVPVSIILAFLGIFTPSSVSGINTDIVRIVAGTSWSTAGLYLMFVPATLGGILFAYNSNKIRIRNIIIANTLIFMGFCATLMTGGRTTLIMYLTTLCLSLLFLLKVKYRSRYNYAFGITFLILVLSGGYLFRPFVIDAFQLMHYRFQIVNEDVSVQGRAEDYGYFLKQLFYEPRLLPIGTGAVQQKVSYSVASHFLFGEAYYVCGLLFMMCLLYGFFVSFYRLWKKRLRSHYYSEVNTCNALLILLFGFLIILSTHPGLHTRIVYVILGTCLSYGQIKFSN